MNVKLFFFKKFRKILKAHSRKQAPDQHWWQAVGQNKGPKQQLGDRPPLCVCTCRGNNFWFSRKLKHVIRCHIVSAEIVVVCHLVNEVDIFFYIMPTDKLKVYFR